jgi:hypothetical protein
MYRRLLYDLLDYCGRKRVDRAVLPHKATFTNHLGIALAKQVLQSRSDQSSSLYLFLNQLSKAVPQ